jgi:S-DNA-T family DNA segregation ATPase FtsK/SpoIIIE
MSKWLELELTWLTIVYQGFDLLLFCLFVCFFFSGIYLIVGISIKKLKIWFWDLFALVVSVLFGFATSLPELGGVVGYELNLFLQDYLGNRNFKLIFGLIIYVIF